MIIFFGDGRLGNQIFQFSFLHSFFKNQKIISFSFIEFFILFKNTPNNLIVKIYNKYLKYLSVKIFNLLFISLSVLRIISSVKPKIKKIYKTECEERKFIKTRGFFPITFVYPYFFQSDFFYKKKIINNFKIRDYHIVKAKNYISKYTNINKVKIFEPVFIHLRRGDYSNLKIGNKTDPSLPFEYYFYGIKWFLKNIHEPFFIFLSDDKNYVKKKFNYLKNKIVSNNNQNVDFSIISLCKYGIISNSSFSYWASSFIINKKVIFAPKYWLGWKSKIEIPHGSLPNFAKVIDPNKSYQCLKQKF